MEAKTERHKKPSPNPNIQVLQAENLENEGYAKASLFLPAFGIETEIDKRLLEQAGFEQQSGFVLVDLQMNAARDRVLGVISIHAIPQKEREEHLPEGEISGFLFY